MKIRKHFSKKGYYGKYLDLRVREYKRTLLFNSITLIFGTIIIILLITNILNGILIENLGREVMDKTSKNFENSNVSYGTYLVCNEFKDEYKKIECVNNFFNQFYEYKDHEGLFQNPEQLINEGGICRDASLFYASILKQMNLKTKFIFEPYHVYLEVYGEDNNYILDQEYFSIIGDKK